VAYRDKNKVATDLRAIYTAPAPEAALPELDPFAERWDESSR
jgi:transposase-like protein